MAERLDKLQVKAWYFQSPHVEWLPFAESMGWDSYATRNRFPVQEWIKEKKERMSQAALERLIDTLFNRESRYHQEILHTLDEMPKMCDRVLKLIDKKIDALDSQLSRNPMSVNSLELMRIASALKTIADAKNSSLFVDRWNFSGLESFITARSPQDQSDENGFVVRVLGKNGEAELKSAEELIRDIASWYDEPKSEVPSNFDDHVAMPSST